MADGGAHPCVCGRFEGCESLDRLGIKMFVEVHHPEILHGLPASRVEGVEPDSITEVAKRRCKSSCGEALVLVNRPASGAGFAGRSGYIE